MGSGTGRVRLALLMAFLTTAAPGRGLARALQGRAGARSAARMLGSARGGDSGGGVGHAIDRDQFRRALDVPALRVRKEYSETAMKRLRPYLMDTYRGLKRVVHDAADGDFRLVLLSDALSEADAQRLAAADGDNGGWAPKADASVVTHRIEVGYDDLSAGQALRMLLPEGVSAPSSFETVGHIIHLNLKEEQLPHRHAIGAVLLDKNKYARTVVNKVGAIASEFRTFDMELLAGDDDYDVALVENGVRFRFDFREVYWNSRLSAAHRTVLDALRGGEVVLDLTCGVGPFAVPAALKGCQVYANDLNPKSTAALTAAAQDCGVPAQSLVVSTEDAAACAARLQGEGLGTPRHVVLNLPQHSVDFLPALRPWLGGGDPMTVHVYAFAEGRDAEEDLVRRCRAALGWEHEPSACEARVARKVTPKRSYVYVRLDFGPADGAG